MNFNQKVIVLIKKIPKGRVATYGQIASLVSTPRAARMVGGILHRDSEKYDLPWPRVINSKGMISPPCQKHSSNLQAKLLQNEGVKVIKKDNNYFIDLKKYLWREA